MNVVGQDGGWISVDLNPSVSLAGKTHIKFDIKTLGVGTSTNLSISLVAAYDWCQGSGFTWVNLNTITMIDIDLVVSSCDQYDLSDVRQVSICLSGGATMYIDGIRAE